jgi:hypothetical protein
VKKFELHMDALIAIVAVFALAVSFLIYQRHQYADLLQENVDLTWENSSLEADLVRMTARFDACKSSVRSIEAPDAQGSPNRSGE